MTKIPFAALLFILIGCIGPQIVLAEPYLGEIRWVAFNFTPRGWMQCNGQILPINQYTALYSLFGNTYGGDGRVNFALPDLRGRAPIHVSPDYSLGGMGGEENHTLTPAEVPNHTHTLKADQREGTSASPTGNYPAKSSSGASAYGSSGGSYLSSGSISNSGGGEAHGNMKPYITLNCIIAVNGIYPTRP